MELGYPCVRESALLYLIPLVSLATTKSCTVRQLRLLTVHSVETPSSVTFLHLVLHGSNCSSLNVEPNVTDAPWLTLRAMTSPLTSPSTMSCLLIV